MEVAPVNTATPGAAGVPVAVMKPLIGGLHAPTIVVSVLFGPA